METNQYKKLKTYETELGWRLEHSQKSLKALTPKWWYDRRDGRPTEVTHEKYNSITNLRQPLWEQMMAYRSALSEFYKIFPKVREGSRIAKLLDLNP